jgi:hypothetical protein
MQRYSFIFLCNSFIFFSLPEQLQNFYAKLMFFLQPLFLNLFFEHFSKSKNGSIYTDENTARKNICYFCTVKNYRTLIPVNYEYIKISIAHAATLQVLFAYQRAGAGDKSGGRYRHFALCLRRAVRRQF